MAARDYESRLLERLATAIRREKRMGEVLHAELTAQEKRATSRVVTTPYPFDLQNHYLALVEERKEIEQKLINLRTKPF